MLQKATRFRDFFLLPGPYSQQEAGGNNESLTVQEPSIREAPFSEQ